MDKTTVIAITIQDAVTILSVENDPTVTQRVYKGVTAANFMHRVRGERCEHRLDIYELGNEWAVAHQKFYAAFGKPENEKPLELLEQAHYGLRRLDARFSEIPAGDLADQPELTYIGLARSILGDCSEVPRLKGIMTQVTKAFPSLMAVLLNNRMAEAA